jgi:polyhydroxybutyrate depolymerase
MALDLNPVEGCPDTTPVPVIAFHGTLDVSAPYNGGIGGITGFMVTFRLPIDNNTPDPDVMAAWATHNGCTGARLESQIDTEVWLISYGSCTNGAVVLLYRVDGGGHTWPGAFDVPQLGYNDAPDQRQRPDVELLLRTLAPRRRRRRRT